MQPLLLLRPDEASQHAFAGEILRSEGIYFFKELSAHSADADDLSQAPLLVTLSGAYPRSLTDRLVAYVREGGNLLTFRPTGQLGNSLGLETGAAMPNTGVLTRPDSGLPESPESLLCPGHTSNALSSEGMVLADLLSAQGRALGAAILSQTIGKGRAISLAYDPVETLTVLRHGWASYDKPPDGSYKGPRSIWAFKGLERLYSKRLPIGDIHADVLRTLIFDLMSPQGVLPRIWHFPDAAKSLFFLKGDGCGEKGADIEVEMAERYGAKFTFYRPRHSRYPGSLMHEWAQRGHAVAPEFDITSVTHGVTMSTVTREVVKRIRALIEDHAESLRSECGVDFETVCFHGCQWVGLPQVQMVEENDWQMITSFISYYPGMQKEGYGIFAIPSFMPMRYYDEAGGLCRMIYAPAAWDESQSLGDPDPRQAGLSTEEYVAEFERVMTESVEQYHLPHITTFHPVYLGYDPADPRYSKAAAEGFLSVCERLRVPCPTIEEWCSFIQDRWSVEVDILELSPARTRLTLKSDRGVKDLSVFLPRATPTTHVTLDGRELQVRSGRFEGQEQRYVILDLPRGKRAEMVIGS